MSEFEILALLLEATIAINKSYEQKWVAGIEWIDNKDTEILDDNNM